MPALVISLPDLLLVLGNNNEKNFATQINNSEWDSFFFGDLIFEMNDRFLIKVNFDLDFCNFADINLNLASKMKNNKKTILENFCSKK